MGPVYAIRAQDLAKFYGPLHAVDGVSFVVKKGEIFGFLGPNGAGKTTTVRMLTGVLPPTRGEAEVLGYDMKRDRIFAKYRSGVVPEMANAYPDLSVWDNLMLMGELYGVPRSKRRERGEELLSIFDLKEKRGQKAKALSKGLRQRLLIAMALVHEPELLFLDEPTSGLDVRSARSIRELLVSINRDGSTVFLTTHNIEEANQLCHRVAMLRKGRIAAAGAPHELRSTFQRVQSVEVSFDQDVEASSLSAIEGVRSTIPQGRGFRLLTDSPTEVASEVVELARGKGWKILSLEIKGPTLEDVFLEVTGEGA